MKYLNILSISLILATIIVCFISDMEKVIFPYLLFGLISLFISKKMFDHLIIRRIVFFSYAFTSMIGVVLILLHYYQFNMPFDVFGDDTRFFEWALYYKDNLLSHSYSGYEKFLAIILNLYNLFGIDDFPELILPLNWMVLSLTIGLSYKLAWLVSNVKLPFSLFFMSLFLNYTFIQNSVHLYRDIYVAFFSILTLVYLIEKQYLKAVFSSISSGFFRFPNAVFNLSIVLINFFLEKRKKTFLFGVIFFFILIVSFGSAVQLGMKIGKYNLQNISEMMAGRTQSYSEKIQKQSGGTATLKKLPLAAQFLFNVPAQVIRPIRFENYYKPLRERYADKKILNHRSIGWSFTVISLIFLVGFYIRGLFLGLFIGTSQVRIFMMTFVLFATVLGFLSFLDRNRVFLIPLFPSLIALNFMNYRLNTIQQKIMRILNKKILSILFLSIVLYGTLKGV